MRAGRWADLKARGITAHEVLDELRAELGGGVTHNVSVDISDASASTAIMSALLHNAPRQLAGIAVVGADDMMQGIDGLPPTSGVRWRLASDSAVTWRVIIRPSGTELKVKCYVEMATAELAEAVAVECARIITAAQA